MGWTLPMGEKHLLAEQLLQLRERDRPRLPVPVVGGPALALRRYVSPSRIAGFLCARLVAAARSRGGMVGPKLLFEDGSIQHAGEGFLPNDDGFGWSPLPYFKGMHRLLPQANVAREVPRAPYC